MSITSRINEMSSHIEQAYDELQGLGADLTNVNKNIENISMVLDDIYDSMPQVSGEGTSLTLDDTRVGKIKSTLKGNTSQDGTPTPSSPIPVNVVSGDNEINICGKNLFGQEKLTIGDGSYEYFKFKELDDNSTYTLSIKLKNGGTAKNMYVGLASNNQNPLQVYSWLLNNGTISVGVLHDDGFRSIVNHFSNQYSSYLVIYRNNIPLQDLFDNYDIQLVKGETYLPYEPYIGNTYPIYLGVENLWNTSKLKDGFVPASGVYPINNTSFPNAKYLLLYLYKGQSLTIANHTDTSQRGRIRYIDKDSNLVIDNVRATTNDYYTSNLEGADGFKNGTITAKKDFIVAFMTIDITDTKVNADVTYGTTPQTISETPIELCKIGTYQDYIYKDNGSWYLHKEIGKVVLDNTLSSVGSTNFSNVYQIYANVMNISYLIGGFCDNFKFNDDSRITDNNNANSYLSDNQCALRLGNESARDRFYVKSTNFATANELKAYFSTNPTTLYYVLATPTNTLIEDTTLIEQLEEIKSANSYEGQTNISQENNDLPFIISASALKEWQDNTSLNSTLSMVNPLSLGNTLNTQDNNTQPIEVDNIEPLEEEENEES